MNYRMMVLPGYYRRIVGPTVSAESGRNGARNGANCQVPFGRQQNRI